MTAEQVTEALPLSAVRGQVRTTAIRQDARRRTAVATVDAAAAMTTAGLLALVMDTLPLTAALAVPACWTLGAWAAGAYNRQRLKVRLVGVRRLALTAVVLWAAAGFVAAIAPIRGVRVLVLVAVPLTAVAVCAARAALLPLTRRGGPLAAAPVVVYGTALGVQAFHAGTGGRTAPVVAATSVYEPSADGGDPDGEALDRVAELVRRTGADTVVVAGDPGHRRPAAETLRALSWRLEPLGAGVALAPFWQVSPGRVTVRACGELTLLEVSPPLYEGARLGLRGLCDRALAVGGLVALAPVLATVAVLVKSTGPAGPVLFRQWRTGKDGRRFRLLKFRTMVPGADAMKTGLGNQYADGTLFKLRDDPRVTRVGAVLRAFSLDELPQLVNVARGDMALVGPRPTSTPPERMRADYRRRTLVKPGLTGLWQVSGRSTLSWEDAVRLDLLYVENRTIAMDLDILRRTVPAVVSRDGAY